MRRKRTNHEGLKVLMTKETNLDNKNSTQRVAIFIDGSNLYHSLEENCGRFDIDFQAFAQKLCSGRQLYRVYYYNVLREAGRNPHAYQDQQKFLGALQDTPYLEIRLGGAKMRGDTPVEKGVDIMVATDLLRLAWEDRYDVGILVSGDGDFAYAVQAVKDLGKHVEIAAFPSNLSGELANVSDKKELFTVKYFDELWNKQRSQGNNRGRSPSKDSGEGDGKRKRKPWFRRSRDQAPNKAPS